MLKIAIITESAKKLFAPGGRFGGGYVVTTELIRVLTGIEGIHVTVFTEEGGYSDIPGAETIEIPISSHSVPLGKPYIEKISDIIDKSHYDCIITSNIFNLYKNNLLQSQTFVGRCASVNPLISMIKKHFSKIKITFEREIFNDLTSENKFIAVSRKVKDDYVKNLGVEPKNIKIIYPGCKQNLKYYEHPEEQHRIRFGIVANSSLNKGGHLFLIAAGLAKLAGCKFDVKIIAPKYQKDIFMKMIIYCFGMKDQCEILNAQNDMTTFYRNIDILVLPSKIEAFGLVVLEAASFGKPSIISSTAGVSEIISQNNGFVFNRNSFYDFCKTIIKVCRMYYKDFDQYREYSKEAFDLSRDYSWENFAKKIIKYTLIEDRQEITDNASDYTEYETADMY